MICSALSRQTFSRRCVLLVDRCTWTGYECDVLGVTVDLRVIDVEVKISRADLKADAAKTKWWHRQLAGYENAQAGGMDVRRPVYHDQPRAWPPRVWKHYYALPADVWTAAAVDWLPSANSGVLLLSRGRHGGVVVRCQRRARPNPGASRLTPHQVVDIARLANLRMWDAYLRASPAPALEAAA